jgi:hypothetical protein
MLPDRYYVALQQSSDFLQVHHEESLEQRAAFS